MGTGMRCLGTINRDEVSWNNYRSIVGDKRGQWVVKEEERNKRKLVCRFQCRGYLYCAVLYCIYTFI